MNKPLFVFVWFVYTLPSISFDTLKAFLISTYIFTHLNYPNLSHTLMPIRRVPEYMSIYFLLVCFPRRKLDLLVPQMPLTISYSNVETEYHGVANVVVESFCYTIFFLELHTPIYQSIHVYCDNVHVIIRQSCVTPINELYQNRH